MRTDQCPCPQRQEKDKLVTCLKGPWIWVNRSEEDGDYNKNLMKTKRKGNVNLMSTSDNLKQVANPLYIGVMST